MLVRIIPHGESGARLPDGLPLKLMNLYYCLPTTFGGNNLRLWSVNKNEIDCILVYL
ncbi:hypothetical protein Scep_023930 [Stephania cephalantha]|uniref:Uncharacterized protein n=1 Tax=Stephania cephalantha TaxID=152367 RepID=A0AAP0HXY2_9MAGN